MTDLGTSRKRPASAWADRARESAELNITLDGIGNNSYSGLTAFVPPADMVQEVRIQTNSYDTAVGHSFGGSINVALKSGTNALRGSLGATGTAGPLITRNFFVDQFIFNPATGPVTDQKIHDNTPAVKWLRYSAVVGGPLVLPKCNAAEISRPF